MSGSQFQLFPPPAPQGVPKNPFRKGPRRPSIDTQSTSSTPLEDLRGKGAEAKAVVFQVVEPHSIKPPPQAHVPPLPPRSFTPELISGPSAESPPRSPPRGESLSNAANSSFVLDDTASPVIAMKSMFPRYNPDAPPAQQPYHRANSNSFSRPRYRPTGLRLDITPAPEIDRALGPKTVPADIYDFPAGMFDAVEVQYSSPAQLKTLWEATNGQRPNNLSGNYNLRMERLDTATFVFGDPSSPFYTMQTYSTNELSITRGSPSIPNSIPVMMLQIEDRCRREAPNDGLVSHLFSRLAAMLAIDQATELSRQHQLSPPDAAEVEKTALKRAAAQESCKLSWNATKRVYELRHPSLSRQYQKQQSQPPTPPALVGAAGIALSPTRPRHTSGGALHISVSTPTNQGQSCGQTQAPTIVVTAPLPNNSVDAALMTSPRISTLPLSGSVSESDEALASLDLRTMTLSISASAISDTIPSLYAIDSIVAAILAVAVSDLSTNPVLGDMPLYDPTQVQPHQQTPTPPQPTYTSTPSNRPKLVATLAERDDLDTRSLELPTYIQTQPQIPKENRKWWSALRAKITQFQTNRRQKAKAKANQKSISPTSPITEEIDLEKYGIKSSPSTKKDTKQKEELPGLARGLIKLFFWGLKLIFWALTVAFKILGWGVNVMFKCVTGEKA
ncbi:hypothetical protein BDW59DRAFT_1295 [Aspergillus cavernicola]|uniref:Uncharacterized protein n=1 Tax=Aspergillus cavernicola TaxID=176166 RepID=A0ABR4J4M4_9EURO